MDDLKIFRIDAFTTEPGRGNPAGVVLDASGLTEHDMQRIARELGHSETAFVLPAKGDDHDLHVRFFSPTTEVPVCGHATVAAHYALAHEGRGASTVRQLTGVGVQTVEVLERGDDFAVRIQQNAPVFEVPLMPELMAEVMAALGVSNLDLDFNCPVQVVSTGSGTLLLGIESLKRLRSLTPNLPRLAELSPMIGSDGYYVFTLETEPDDDAFVHGRMFAPAVGVDEDPVTGNANAPLGAYLVRYGLLQPHGNIARFRARQQAASGRGGFIDVEVISHEGEPVAVTIEGRAVLGTHVAPSLA